jgi:thioesterase domain-containing protein
MIDADPSAIGEVVKVAWSETLPGEAFSPDLAWADAGGDSITAMQLIMRLETELGRKVPFDMLSPETTPAQLAMAIGQAGAETEDHLPVVHLIPGVGGDEPVLANFRRAFAESIRFEVVEMPGLDQPADLLIRFSGSARWIVKRIDVAQPTGAVMLAGYSYGASLAVEVAHQFALRGRPVSFLCLLDPGGQEEATPVKVEPSAAKPFPPTRRERWRDAIRLILGRPALSPEAASVPAPQGPAYGYATIKPPRRSWKEDCLVDLRTLSVRRWKPSAPVDCDTLLIHTDAGLRLRSPEYWGQFLPNLRSVLVAASHRRMFDPEPLSHYRDLILEEVVGHAVLANVETAAQRRAIS